MEKNEQKINTEDKPKRGSLKWKVYLVFLVFVLCAGAYGYWWIQETNSLRDEAQQVIEQAGKYDTLQAKVKNEHTRCENFIAQKEGDFGSFEYCKKFIDWSDILPSD
jgi:uncharacterized protein HemX